MKLKTIQARLAYNKKAYGIPELASSDDRRFVRICIAHHLAEKNFYELLNNDTILPEKYGPSYHEDKDTYDKLLVTLGNIEKDPRYEGIVKKVSYLYETPLHGRMITLGYNLTGQEFFDTIAPFKKDIEEFFFSFTHSMPQFPLKYEDVYKGIEGTYQYGIPANLLLNIKGDNDIWEKLVEDAMKVTKLQAVSVMSEEMGHKIREKYPHLKIHISTHGVNSLDPDNLDIDLIDTVNIDEPEMYNSQRIIDACLKAGIKIKFIVNRDCMLGRYHTLSKFAGKPIKCCQGTHGPCFQARREHPWLELATTALYKEQALHSYASYIKLSTRELNNEIIKDMLEYWTNYKSTQMIGIATRITDASYPIFLEWIKLRETCSGDCFSCRKCKDVYARIIEANQEKPPSKEEYDAKVLSTESACVKKEDKPCQ